MDKSISVICVGDNQRGTKRKDGLAEFLGMLLGHRHTKKNKENEVRAAYQKCLSEEVKERPGVRTMGVDKKDVVTTAVRKIELDDQGLLVIKGMPDSKDPRTGWGFAVDLVNLIDKYEDYPFDESKDEYMATCSIRTRDTNTVLDSKDGLEYKHQIAVCWIKPREGRITWYNDDEDMTAFVIVDLPLSDSVKLMKFHPKDKVDPYRHARCIVENNKLRRKLVDALGTLKQALEQITPGVHNERMYQSLSKDADGVLVDGVFKPNKRDGTEKEGETNKGDGDESEKEGESNKEDGDEPEKGENTEEPESRFVSEGDRVFDRANAREVVSRAFDMKPVEKRANEISEEEKPKKEDE